MRKILVLITALLIICSSNLRAETEKECFEKVRDQFLNLMKVWTIL